MDSNSFHDLICVSCRRNFGQLNAYSNHVRTCRVQKKRTASALEAAKQMHNHKKLRVTVQKALNSEENHGQGATHDVPSEGAVVEVSVVLCFISFQLLSFEG